MELTIPYDINVIAIGPDCFTQTFLIDNINDPNQRDNQIFFLDSLQLLPTTDFHFQYITAVSGDQCHGNYVLKAPVKINASYQWYRDSIAIVGASDSIYKVPDSVSAESHYNVKITTQLSCVVSETFTVKANRLNQLRLPADTTICAGDTALLLPHLSGVSYAWNARSDTIVKVDQQGLYTITASDIAGCKKVLTINVHSNGCLQCKLYIPNAFTPNSDGRNDVFKVRFGCPVQNFTMQIYNRWGEKIFETYDPYAGWDGNFKGTKVSIGAYVYMIQYSTVAEKNKTAKGTVMVIR